MITLLTDFGETDHYVAAMKGVIAAIDPRIPVVDAAHAVPPQDIAHAAWTLRNYWRFFPPGAVHTVVVDPGVGSDRHGLVLQARGHFFVGPDNGVFSWILRETPDAEHYVIGPSLHRGAAVSRTFHGRDIFAVVAAHLVRDPAHVFADLAPCPNPIRLDGLDHAANGNILTGRVIHIDHFGNAITNIPAEALPPGEHRVRCDDPALTWPAIHATYGDVAPGESLVLVGSHGFVELAVNGGHVARGAGITRGAVIHIDCNPR